MSSQPGLFHFPERCRFGRAIPKTRIVAAGRAGRKVRDQLTRTIAQIHWQYKLAPETVNLANSDAVPEIQIVTLTLKVSGFGENLPEDILRCIDRAIHFPTLFELVEPHETNASGGRIRVAAAYKRPSEADAGRWVIGDYLATDWLPGDTERSPLPTALDLPRLYEQMLRQLIPLTAREGEPLPALMERHGRIITLERECRRLESRLQRETQFNRKVEINRALREAEASLATLRAGN